MEGEENEVEDPSTLTTYCGKCGSDWRAMVLWWSSMSPLSRLHHRDIMTIVELAFIYVPFITICWYIKDSAAHRCRQQCLVAEWLVLQLGLGLGVWPGNGSHG